MVPVIPFIRVSEISEGWGGVSQGQCQKVASYIGFDSVSQCQRQLFGESQSLVRVRAHRPSFDNWFDSKFQVFKSWRFLTQAIEVNLTSNLIYQYINPNNSKGRMIWIVWASSSINLSPNNSKERTIWIVWVPSGRRVSHLSYQCIMPNNSKHSMIWIVWST